MKAKVTGNALIITSDIDAADMALVDGVEKCLDENGNEVYAICYDPFTAVGSVNKVSAVFNSKTRNGKMQLTILVKDTGYDAITNAYADALTNLSIAEHIVAESINEKKLRRTATMECVSFEDAPAIEAEAEAEANAVMGIEVTE